MANSNKGTRNAIIATVILTVIGIGAYIVYKRVTKNDGLSKADMVNQILSNSGGSGDYGFLMSLSSDYITAWYKSVKDKMPTFVIGGQTFDSITGKQK